MAILEALPLQPCEAILLQIGRLHTHQHVAGGAGGCVAEMTMAV
jgi:hypothetical protein